MESSRKPRFRPFGTSIAGPRIMRSDRVLLQLSARCKEVSRTGRGQVPVAPSTEVRLTGLRRLHEKLMHYAAGSRVTSGTHPPSGRRRSAAPDPAKRCFGLRTAYAARVRGTKTNRSSRMAGWWTPLFVWYCQACRRRRASGAGLKHVDEGTMFNDMAVVSRVDVTVTGVRSRRRTLGKIAQ